MTQEEIKEFWRTQTIIQMKDIVNVQGKAYVKSSSVERISKEYDLPSFPKGQFIPLVEFGPLVMKAYKKKQDRRDFAMDHKEEIKTVVKYFKTKVSSLSEDKRTNSSFVASYLVLQFAFEDPKTVIEGIQIAAREELVSNPEELITQYQKFSKFFHLCRGERKWNSVEGIAEALYQGYKEGLPFRQLRGMLLVQNMDANMVNKVECAFYDKLMPELEDYCRQVKKRGSLLRKDIEARYGDLDLEAVLNRMDTIAGDKLQIKAIYASIKPEVVTGQVSEILMSVSRKDISVKEAFQQLLDLRYPDYIVLGEISKLKEKGLVLPYQGLFDAYYEKFTHSGMEVVVDNYLKKAAKEQYSAKQIVIKLRTFGYPDEFMARFLDQHIDLDLPFEEIYPLLGRKKNKAVIVPVEEIQPSVREVAHISPDGEGFTQQPSLKDLLMVEGKKHDAIVEAEERAEEEEKEVKLPPRKPHKTGKVHKIVNREEAITTLDKKALVSLCIAAAGSISTAVLVCLFKVNPAVAAKNCVDSINAFVSGSTGLQQILPPAKELVSILGTVGTTIAGTIAYLRSNSKRKKLMQEDEREQTKEMDAVLSEQQQKIGEFVSEVLAEQEEEKGGKRL